MEYFISRDSKVSGPFSKQQVLAGIKSKKLRKTDLVGTSANGPWQTVQDAVGTKTPKASTAKKPVESEAQNKQSNASAEEYDDFWDDLPDPSAASSSPVAPTLSNDYLAKAEAELKKRKVEEAAEQSEMHKAKKLRIVICVLVVIFGVFGFFAALQISKPYKLKWAADTQLRRLMVNAAALEMLGGNLDERSRQRAYNHSAKMEIAAAELEMILGQMSPETREAWQASKMENAVMREMRGISSGF